MSHYTLHQSIAINAINNEKLATQLGQINILSSFLNAFTFWCSVVDNYNLMSFSLFHCVNLHNIKKLSSDDTLNVCMILSK